MYQPYPGGAFPPDRQPPFAQPPVAPQSVTVARRLMYAGATVTLLAIAGNLILSSSLRRQIQHDHPGFTSAQVSSALHAALGGDIAGAVISAALWLLMAQLCQAGRGPARVIATVLFGLDTIIAPLLAVATAGANHAWAVIPPLVIWAVGLVTIIMPWRRDSTAYFRASAYSRSAPRHQA